MSVGYILDSLQMDDYCLECMGLCTVYRRFKIQDVELWQLLDVIYRLLLVTVYVWAHYLLLMLLAMSYVSC